MNLPLHKISLECELVSGEVVVTLSPQLPIDGVTLLLGNDLAEGRVHATPRVTSRPQVISVPDDLEQSFPDTFLVCAVTRAMTRQKDKEQEVDQSDSCLSDTFMASIHLDFTGFGKSVQSADPSLCALFEEDVFEDDIAEEPRGYFFSNEVLMRKWMPSYMSSQDDWSCVFQIVVPACFRTEILRLAHDHCLSGHLGIRKTWDRVVRHFYWPGARSDVSQYCWSCHVCQVVGKPNQKIPAAPLHPIPAAGEPFERVLIDSVGPLPRCKSGNQYLLTIMCAATRFPEAVPLRKITASAISKALIKFFSV